MSLPTKNRVSFFISLFIGNDNSEKWPHLADALKELPRLTGDACAINTPRYAILIDGEEKYALLAEGLRGALRDMQAEIDSAASRPGGAEAWLRNHLPELFAERPKENPHE